jgi:Mg-chelatase subunit ChlD
VKKDYSHITIILDRSGSMESIRDDTLGGFNTFLKEQKKESGTATLTLVQFDSQDPFEIIHDFEDIKKIPKLTRETFVPRASTPLFDALGRGINDLEKNLSELKVKAHPSKVVVVVVTDGKENASREFQKGQIEIMIKDKIEQSDWQFVFLSADLAAIGDARGVGIQAAASLPFKKDRKGTASAWASLSNRTSDYRSDRKKNVSFEQDDRQHPDDPNLKKEES